MHWSPPPRPTPVLSRRQWSGATGWAPNSGGRSHSPCPFLSLPSALCPFSRAASISGDFGLGAWRGGCLLLRLWSPQSEQLQCGGRSCPGHPLSCPGGPGPGTSPSPVTSTHCLRWGRGRAPASPSLSALLPTPTPALALGVAPGWSPLPPNICWKVQRRGGGRSPAWLPVSLDRVACSCPRTPPPARPHSAPCPVPFFCIWKQRVVINPEMDVFSMPLAASFFRLVGGWSGERGAVALKAS